MIPPEPFPPSLMDAKQGEAEQPFLFSEEELDQAFEITEAQGESTGERIAARRPKIYALAVRMLSEGLGIRQISRALGISTNTVLAIRRRGQPSVDTLKQQVLELTRDAVHLSIERILELVPSMTGRDASITFGILVEKWQLLQGECTAIVGHTDVISHSDFNALLQALPRADIREVSSQMDLGADSEAQKAQADPPAAPPAPGQLAQPPSPAGSFPSSPADAESDAFQSNEARRNIQRNTLPSDLEANWPTASQEGEGGVARAGAPVPPD